MYLATYQPLAAEEGKNPLDSIMTMDRRYTDYFGFKPVWCIPMNTPEDFLAHSMFSAPNIPMMLYIVDADEYVRIDKIRHYKRLMTEDDSLAGLECREDDRYCEFVIDAKELENALVIPLMQDYSGFTVLRRNKQLSDEIRAKMYSISRPFDNLNANPDNAMDMLDYFDGNEDLLRQRLSGEILKKKFETCALVPVWNMLFRTEVKSLHVDAVSKDLSRHRQIYDEFVDWFNGDCGVQEYDKVFEDAKSLIINDTDTLVKLKLSNPERNDLCPCGSGKKYKKCHGLYKHYFEVTI